MEEYHACQCVNEYPADDITLSEALDPLTIGARLQSLGVWTATVASGKKQEVLQAYLALSRSKEEVAMLENEARNIVNYYERRKKVVIEEIESHSLKFDSLSRGTTALLYFFLAKINNLLEQGYVTLQVMTNVDHKLPLDVLKDDSDDDIDSNTSDCSSDEL